MNIRHSKDYMDARSLECLIPDPDAVACISETVARRLQCVPLALTHLNPLERLLLLAIATPQNSNVQEKIVRQLPAGVVADFIYVNDASYEEVLDKCYEEGLAGESLIQQCLHLKKESQVPDIAPHRIVRLVEAILRSACQRGASDIHIASGLNGLCVRFRIDGVLENFAILHSTYMESFIGRIKILSSLDIAETRLPQDGQFMQFVEGRIRHFRVSIFPTVTGENVVVRVLGAESGKYDKNSIFLTEKVKNQLLECLHYPDGLIVFCGPTGSGKSTSLYALLNELDRSALNIMTLEDPVEIVMPDVRQTNIDLAREFGYAEGLRAMLRQDPDVILIGEVRDKQSAFMMLRASMTGHRVLTTVHASDAISALDRLVELGANRELLSRSIRCIVSQRLIRKTCQQCSDIVDPECRCRGTGYYGRQAIMELLRVTPDLSVLIRESAPKEKLQAHARLNGYESLFEQAQTVLDRGITDSKEIHRVLGSADTVSFSAVGREKEF